MEKQIDALSNLWLLSQFVGMVTDSRSFLSYSRHEYFRRLLCNLLARTSARGSSRTTGPCSSGWWRVCFFNARQYLGVEVGSLGRGIEPPPA